MIPYVREMRVDYGRAQRVSPRIVRVLAENPGPFTFHGTGTYLVGEETLAVIDPGPLVNAHLEALVEAIGGRPVSHILTTHTHADHSPLSHPLQARVGGEIVGRSAPPSAPSLEEPDEAAFRPDVEVADGARIVGDGWTLEALATPGHASNHVAYALTEENALFCGDHVMGWSTTVISPPDGDMSDYYESLAKVQSRGFVTLWPTHGPPVTDPAPFLAGYRAHRLARERQVLIELRKGPRTITAMAPRLYAGVDPRLHGAAARSLWAHLIHLTRTGATAVEGGGAPTLEATYRVT